MDGTTVPPVIGTKVLENAKKLYGVTLCADNSAKVEKSSNNETMILRESLELSINFISSINFL
jgi:hypothetical protein